MRAQAGGPPWPIVYKLTSWHQVAIIGLMVSLAAHSFANPVARQATPAEMGPIEADDEALLDNIDYLYEGDWGYSNEIDLISTKSTSLEACQDNKWHVCVDCRGQDGLVSAYMAGFGTFLDYIQIM
jgi:hypothetical protein